MESCYSSDILEKFDLFKKGSFLILKQWPAFRMALDHNPELLIVYADEEKKELEIYYFLRCVLSDIDDEIVKKNHSMIVANIIGGILLDFIINYFNIDVEDNSEKLIASDILKLHSQIFREDKLTYYNELEKSASLFKGEFSIEFPITKNSVEKKILLNKDKKVEDEESGEESEDEEMEEEKKDDKKEEKIINKNLSQPDDDGFSQVLKSKKKKDNFDENVEMKVVENNEPDADGFFEVKNKKKR